MLLSADDDGSHDGGMNLAATTLLGTAGPNMIMAAVRAVQSEGSVAHSSHSKKKNGRPGSRGLPSLSPGRADTTNALDLNLPTNAAPDDAARYQNLVEQMPAATYVEALDEQQQDWRMLYVSPQIEEMLGYLSHEWLTQPDLWARLLHPDDRARALAEDARTEATGQRFRAEYRLIARDGRTVWVYDSAALVRDEHGVPRFWQGIMLDVTPQKQAVQAIQRSEARFQSLVEHCADLISVVDAAGIRQYASPSYERLLGYRPDELEGRPIEEVTHPDDQELDRRFFAALAQQPGAVDQFEARVLHRDGSVRWLEVVATNRLSRSR